MTRSAPAAFDRNSSLIALLVIGSIRWLNEAATRRVKVEGGKVRSNIFSLPLLWLLD